MQVRTPSWDFSKVRAHWAQDHEFAQIQNAASTIPAYIEPYLVKVMVKAKAALDPKNERLHRELGIFIKQEMQHCKQHLRFNQALKDSGYLKSCPWRRSTKTITTNFSRRNRSASTAHTAKGLKR
jgi:predicted metal-dependent hydrolase